MLWVLFIFQSGEKWMKNVRNVHGSLPFGAAFKTGLCERGSLRLAQQSRININFPIFFLFSPSRTVSSSGKSIWTRAVGCTEWAEPQG